MVSIKSGTPCYGVVPAESLPRSQAWVCPVVAERVSARAGAATSWRCLSALQRGRVPAERRRRGIRGRVWEGGSVRRSAGGRRTCSARWQAGVLTHLHRGCAIRVGGVLKHVIGPALDAARGPARAVCTARTAHTEVNFRDKISPWLGGSLRDARSAVRPTAWRPLCSLIEGTRALTTCNRKSQTSMAVCAPLCRRLRVPFRGTEARRATTPQYCQQ